ncbi:platelet factor 4-like isoform X1 [Pipistrellus kuhlii]|uniref:platelet factor 4-like isoform X1 n=1 Tax=Pipistrellus kuhlii TaxID=59472 RepID=UPI00174EFBF2|nr:platelet factor 4-like isoform X1 [Pipistrellus kuhlii]
MSLQAGSRASRPWPSPVLLLLGLLLLQAVVAQVIAEPQEGGGDLQCLCVKTSTGVHPKHIASMELIRAGLHCPNTQMIVTLKNGKKICLDPNTSVYKKIIKNFMKSKPPTD